MRQLNWMPHQRAPAWGEGLVDQSLTSLWYPRNGKELDRDEFTYFMPGIQLRADTGLLTFLREARTAQFCRTVATLGRLWPRDIQCEREACAIRLIQSLGFASEPARECPRPMSNQNRSGFRLIWAGGLEASAIYELSVLAAVDRMVCDAEKIADGGSGHCAHGRDICEVFIASMHSGINGAYVYESLAYAHETFATGAWIGHLLGGRPALLPDFIAAFFVETWLRAEHEERTSVLDQLIFDHAHATTDVRKLLRKSRRELKTGLPALINPRRWPAPAAARCAWNGELERRISDAIRTVSRETANQLT